VALSSVIEDYEAAFIARRGYSPGVVMPSMLAALGAPSSTGPTLVIKVDAAHYEYLPSSISNSYCFSHSGKYSRVYHHREQLAEEVYPSVVFFQDTYHLNIDKIFCGGFTGIGRRSAGFACSNWRRSQGIWWLIAIGEKASAPFPKWRMAGVVGALLS